ncbi:sugar ABC transporter permease [Litorilinea aerophila]|uniref:Sugar ABC transporter permease n=1 Tax=Litorilinea aerophila TaxID=1204385 RepID=A0A540VN36_9CHLR|nr:sugar ABC transporter permease [Litorilinea aerophila]MCC9074758.1 sugar ABC transporter permease [Litorilinea aerophila]OUC07014.1 spermidine/putrescine ABC transporter permease [Litorilinea aerophila]GIV77920.1 MAG: ABC transporter permease [Litorilinea sp.]
MAVLGRPRGMTKNEWRNQVLGMLFVSPWLIGFLLFSFFPLIASVYYSLTNYDFIREPQFIGLKNYVRLFTVDPDFWTVMYNTVYYVGIGVPLGVATAFIIANLLNSDVWGRTVFRSIIYVPSIVPAVCTAVVWLFIFNVQYGVINGVLKYFELPTIPFLSNPSLAKPSLILIYIWAQGAAVVIFLAALQDVPKTLYEAATVDGASTWDKFWHVTVPLCTPVILFNFIMGIISAFQDFTLPFVLTGGGPMKSTEFYVVNLYRNAFVQFSLGKASAMAWILFLIILVFSLLLFRSSARWVYYGGEK